MTPTATFPATAPLAPAGPPPLTLDEFLAGAAGASVEVVDGVVKEIPMPQPLHGQVCVKATLRIAGFVEDHDLGVACSNDTFVLIRKSPLQVRGADLVYWSKSKAPDGVPAQGMIEAPPDLCVEVVSPTNTWDEVFTKVGEYLRIGVPAVVVLAPDSRTASVYRRQPGVAQEIFHATDTLTLPDVLPGFAVPVRRFFE